MGSCYNELVSIEKGELRALQQLQAFNALYVALQNITDSVEITDHQLNTEVGGLTFAIISMEHFNRSWCI